MIIAKNLNHLLSNEDVRTEALNYIIGSMSESELKKIRAEITSRVGVRDLLEERKSEFISAIDPLDYIEKWRPEIEQSIKSGSLHDISLTLIDAEEFYQARKIDVNKVFHEMLSKIKFDRQKMEYRYVDSDGHTYHGFPSKLGLPIERFGKMKSYLMWMISGISPKELRDLLDKADDALGKGIADPKQAAVIGMVHEEIRGRERLTIHTELLYNFMAVQWVRDDEDPLTFNNQIQLEKVESFKRESSKGNSYFFFRQKEMKMLSNLFKMSEEEWNKYWQESLNNQAYLQALRIMKYSSVKEEGPSKETSKNP